jgi:Gamma-aminobutyrate permease and related permeases
MIAIMSVYPWNKITTTASPFVQVFSGIGITGAAGILNFVVLTAALSATNSCLFSTSRTLHALSWGGNAPKGLAKLNKSGVPTNSLNFSALVLLIIVVLNYLMPASVFTMISGVSTLTCASLGDFDLVPHPLSARSSRRCADLQDARLSLHGLD